MRCCHTQNQSCQEKQCQDVLKEERMKEASVWGGRVFGM